MYEGIAVVVQLDGRACNCKQVGDQFLKDFSGLLFLKIT
jgi:hypothetical protein